MVYRDVKKLFSPALPAMSYMSTPFECYYTVLFSRHCVGERKQMGEITHMPYFILHTVASIFMAIKCVLRDSEAECSWVLSSQLAMSLTSPADADRNVPTRNLYWPFLILLTSHT